MVEHVDGQLPGSGLYWQGWAPPGAVKGVVAIVHGLHEHGGRYAHVAQRLATEGYASYAVDHTGHGRSPGVRGNIGRTSQVVAGVDALVQWAGSRHPGVPVFLLGHSMGGLIALEYLSDEPPQLAGAVISAPAVDVSLVSPPQRLAAAVLSTVAPNIGLLTLDSSMVSRDPEVVAGYDSDPLNYRGPTRARTGAEIIATARRMPRRLARIAVPVLLLHGTEDRLVSIAGSELVARHLTGDLSFKRYDGLYHEVLNEPEKQAVLDDIVDWLAGHRASPATEAPDDGTRDRAHGGGALSRRRPDRR